MIKLFFSQNNFFLNHPSLQTSKRLSIIVPLLLIIAVLSCIVVFVSLPIETIELNNYFLFIFPDTLY